MAEDKIMCGKGCCCSGKKYMFVGVLAIVYGAINYMISVMGWEMYMAWIVGGLILLLISWMKGSMKN
jgi:hypothetical protein